MQNFRVIIPAGGRSSRSGLTYSKTLHKVGGLPILVRICRLVEDYDRSPVIIINPSSEIQFRSVLDEYKVNAQLIFQPEPKGMGDAVLRAGSAIKDDTNVILIWSDIPLLSKLTLKHLINCHSVSENDFSMITSMGNNCYTIIERENGKLTGVKETRVLGIKPLEYGERDIGLFAFKKQPVFNILKQQAAHHLNNSATEQGFLCMVEELFRSGYKIEGYPVALPADLLSFNTPAELKLIEDMINEK